MVKLPPDNVEVRVMCGDPIAVAWKRLVEISNDWMKQDPALNPLYLVHETQHFLDVQRNRRHFLTTSIHVKTQYNTVLQLREAMQVLLGTKININALTGMFSRIY